MPRIRSIVLHVEVDEAKRAHNCQGNARHRISKGDGRLKVINGRSWDHYCCPCAAVIVSRDIERLQLLQRQFHIATAR